MTQWYYELLGEEFGPVSESSLRQLLIDGTLGPVDRVRQVDSGDWIPLSAASIDVAVDDGTAERVADESDVVRDLSELNFEFEESAAPAAATNGSRKKSSAVVDRQAGPSQYYYQFFGQTLGPIPLETLIRMAEAGRLQETDLVRAEEDFLWQAAGEFSELSAAFLLRMPETPAAAVAVPPVASAPVTAAVVAPEPVPVPTVQAQVPSVVPAAAAATATATATATTGGASKSMGTGSGTKAKSGRGKKKDRRAEEKLVDNILSEVFAEEEEEDAGPAGESSSAASARDAGALRGSGVAGSGSGAGSSVAASVAPEVVPSPAAPRSWGAASTTAQSSAAAAAAARPALRSAPKSKSSAGGSWLPNIQLEFNGPVQALLGLGLLAAIWFGYTPLMRYFKTDEARYISRMELAIETCEKLNPVTEAVKFKGQQELMKREFGAYAALMTEAGSTRQSAKNCLGALNRLMEFAAVDPQNTVLQKKLLDEAKSLIKKYRGA